MSFYRKNSNFREGIASAVQQAAPALWRKLKRPSRSTVNILRGLTGEAQQRIDELHSQAISDSIVIARLIAQREELLNEVQNLSALFAEANRALRRSLFSQLTKKQPGAKHRARTQALQRSAYDSTFGYFFSIGGP
jgi:hypothetical protein